MSHSAETEPYAYNGPVVKLLRSFDQFKFGDAVDQFGPAVASIKHGVTEWTNNNPREAMILISGAAVAATIGLGYLGNAPAGLALLEKTAEAVAPILGETTQAGITMVNHGLSLVGYLTEMAVGFSGAVVLAHSALPEEKEQAWFDAVKSRAQSRKLAIS